MNKPAGEPQCVTGGLGEFAPGSGTEPCFDPHSPRARLLQTRYWWDRHGRRHSLAEMEARYLIAVVHFLERNACWFRSLQGVSEIEGEIKLAPGQPSALSDESDPEWLRSTSLYRALQGSLSGVPLERSQTGSGQEGGRR